VYDSGQQGAEKGGVREVDQKKDGFLRVTVPQPNRWCVACIRVRTPWRQRQRYTCTSTRTNRKGAGSGGDAAPYTSSPDVRKPTRSFVYRCVSFRQRPYVPRGIRGRQRFTIDWRVCQSRPGMRLSRLNPQYDMVNSGVLRWQRFYRDNDQNPYYPQKRHEP
jgi:hypothetical protein